jgi:hypothetical protein
MIKNLLGLFAISAIVAGVQLPSQAQNMTISPVQTNPTACANTQNVPWLYFPAKYNSLFQGNTPARCVNTNAMVLTNPDVFIEGNLEQVALGPLATEQAYYTASYQALGSAPMWQSNLYNPFQWTGARSKLKVCNLKANLAKNFVVKTTPSNNPSNTFNAEVIICRGIKVPFRSKSDLLNGWKTVRATAQMNLFWSGNYSADVTLPQNVKVYAPNSPFGTYVIGKGVLLP